MARTSRKNIVAPVKSPPTPKSEYSAALYARISVEDERKREADTIGNQIQLLRDFAGEDPDISVFDVYCALCLMKKAKTLRAPVLPSL